MSCVICASFYRQTSPAWTLQSMALDSTRRNNEIRLFEDTTKAQFLVTLRFKM